MSVTSVTIVTTSVIPLFCLLIFSIVPSVSAISSNYSNYTSNYTSNNNYLEQVQANYSLEKSSNWKLGNGLSEGDYFVYKICNNNTMYQVIYPYHCYTISLEFVTILESYQGMVWVVQGNFTTPVISSKMIFLIDSTTFEVSTDLLNVNLGNSIQNTIFSLSQYGGIDGTSLSIGTVWDYLDSYFTNDIPLEIKNKQTIQILNDTIEVSVLSYDIIIPSNTYLHNDFPFPLKAVMYSPNIIYPEPQELYYYELVEYSTIDTIVDTMIDTKRNIQGELKVR